MVVTSGNEVCGQFNIIFKPLPQFNGKHVVFGRVSLFTIFAPIKMGFTRRKRTKIIMDFDYKSYMAAGDIRCIEKLNNPILLMFLNDEPLGVLTCSSHNTTLEIVLHMCVFNMKYGQQEDCLLHGMYLYSHHHPLTFGEPETATMAEKILLITRTSLQISICYR